MKKLIYLLIYILGYAVSWGFTYKLGDKRHKEANLCLTYGDITTISCISFGSWLTVGCVGLVWALDEVTPLFNTEFLNKPLNCN